MKGGSFLKLSVSKIRGLPLTKDYEYKKHSISVFNKNFSPIFNIFCFYYSTYYKKRVGKLNSLSVI